MGALSRPEEKLSKRKCTVKIELDCKTTVIIGTGYADGGLLKLLSVLEKFPILSLHGWNEDIKHLARKATWQN